MAISSLGFKTITLFSRQILKIDDAPVNSSLIFWLCFAEMICSFPRNSPMGDYQNNNEPFYGGRKSMVFERKKILLVLIVWSYSFHTMYFKYETAKLAKKKVFKDLIIVGL